MAIGDGGGGAPVNFGYFLQQKYAALQQQADATTSNAASQAITANAQAGALGASAGLDKARTSVLPATSAAEIALQNAQAGLVGEQAKVVAPTAAANIAQTGAQTTGITQANKFFNLVNLTGANGSAAGTTTSPGILGPAGYNGYRLPTVPAPVGAQRPGESAAAYLDRQNGL